MKEKEYKSKKMKKIVLNSISYKKTPKSQSQSLSISNDPIDSYMFLRDEITYAT